jgi:hypothetical protein
MTDQTAVVTAIQGLKDDLDARHGENVTRHAITDLKVDEAIRRIDDLHKGFPAGDWDGHRRYHEAIIKQAEDRAKFYQELCVELATKGLWAVLALLATAVGFYIKSKLSSS